MAIKTLEVIVRPLVLWEPAPYVVNVKHSDTLRVYASFVYSGPSKSCKLRGEIGQRTLWTDNFDSIVLQDSLSFTIGPDDTPRTYNRTVDVPITTALAAGKPYSIYAKLINGISYEEGETGSLILEDAIFVVSAEPTFSEFKIDNYTKV